MERGIKAYLEVVRPPKDFRVNGLEMTPDEYSGEVVKAFVSPIVANEIHRLLNEYAEKCVKMTKTNEELAFSRGAIDALTRVLELGKTKTKKVNVI